MANTALSCHRAGSLPGTGPHPLLHDSAVQSVAQREAEPRRNMSGNILVTLVPNRVLHRFLDGDSGPKLSSRDQRTVKAEESPEEGKSVRFACNVIAWLIRGAGSQCARVDSADLWRELRERVENCLDVAPAHNSGCRPKMQIQIHKIPSVFS